MKIKKEIYPKTKRFSTTNNPKIEITEKMDGSNLAIFKKDGIIYVAQRNNIFSEEDFSEITYKGLKGWLDEHLEYFKEHLYEGSVLCGEWMVEHQGQYGERAEKKFYQFAKANINDKLDLYNINYYHELFKYSWQNQGEEPYTPDFIGIVPVVLVNDNLLSLKDLDDLYYEYSEGHTKFVEGFVINYSNSIVKYVRMKSGKLEDHHE